MNTDAAPKVDTQCARRARRDPHSEACSAAQRQVRTSISQRKEAPSIDGASSAH